MFEKKDSEFIGWIERNPDGYVINALRSRSPKYFVLHRSGCKIISTYVKKTPGKSKPRRPRGGFTERQYIKIGSNSISSLRNWVKKNGRTNGSFTKHCALCNPLSGIVTKQAIPGLHAITREAVLFAIKECDQLGHDKFRAKYGFGRARDYFLIYRGKRYDSKAIAGVSHKFVNPSSGSLKKETFSGGLTTVRKKLVELGFEVTIAGKRFNTMNAQVAEAEDTLVESGQFDPANASDAREKTIGNIVRRRGQPRFRRKLLKAYGGKCAVTQCDCIEVLEAAHIKPYLGEHSNSVTNGVLLRGDIHTLFDLHLVSMDASGKIKVSKFLRKTSYWALNGTQFHEPVNANHRPHSKALAWHCALLRQA